MSKNSVRDAKIIAYASKLRGEFSYQLIADKFGVTRNVVAGVLFRHAHPYETLVKSPGSRRRNKIGTGYRRRTYWPTNTAHVAGPTK